MFLRLHRRPLYIYFIDGSEDDVEDINQGKRSIVLRGRGRLGFASIDYWFVVRLITAADCFLDDIDSH